MKTPIRWAFAAVAGLLIAVAGPARAQDDSLNLIPSKAPIVIQVNGFEKAHKRLGTFLGNALPDIAPKLSKQIDDGIKELTQGRDLKSITKDGRLYLVISDLADIAENPQISLMIPVTSYAEFKKGFLKDDERKTLKKHDDGYESLKMADKEEPFYLVERKGYVVGTIDADVAKSFAKSDDTGLGKVLSKDTAKAFLDQDVSVYVNLKTINKEYGAKIRGFKTLFEGILGAGGMVDKKQAEMIKTMFDSLVSLLDDGVATVIGIDFRPEGANLHFAAQFGSETETNAFLKKLKPATLKEIGLLPGGQMLYSASNFDSSQSKTLSAMMREAIADDEDEDAKKAILAAIKEMSESGQVFEVTANNTLGSGLQVAEFKDGAKAVASQLKLFKAISKSGSFGNVPLKKKPEIKENAETVGDYKLHMVKLDFDFDKAVQDIPEPLKESTKNSMIKMAGEAGTIWFGNSGNKVIEVSGKDWKTAKSAIEEYLAGKSPLDQDESFKTTRKQLPADATLLMLADTTRLIQIIMEFAKDAFAGVPGFPGGALPDLKAPKGNPAYFGIAIVLKAEYASFDLFVPVTAIQQVRKMFAPLIDGDN